MEEREAISLNSIPPLHRGRSFFCYRDVNKAIEKHRELYGLRLALKRAVKLENYCLTVDQMKDLNLRLKYGELDYHCFAATGRPGRPGNDERCPQLIRLKLSADAQSLVVYESHNHNILPYSDGVQKAQPPVKQKMDFFGPLPHDRPCIRGDITLTPINPVQKNPVLILPKPITGGEIQQAPQPALTLAKSFFINNNSFGALTPVSEINSITITPTPSPQPPVRIYPQAGNNNISQSEGEKNEKITLRFKKSQVAPNEMIIVGSLRDTEEQLKSKGHEDPALNDKQPDILPMQPVNASPNEPLSKPVSQIAKITKEQEGFPNVSSPGLIPKAATNALPKPGNPPKMVSNNLKPLSSNNQTPKLNSGINTASTAKSGMNKPGAGVIRKTPSPSSGNQGFKPPISQSPKDGIQSKPKPIAPTAAKTTSPTTTLSTVAKPTVLKQSANMKQIITKKSTQVGDVNPKPVIPNRPPSGMGKVSPNTVHTGLNKPQNETKLTPVGGIKQPVSVAKPVFKSSNPVKPIVGKLTDGSALDRKIVPKPIQNPKISNSKSAVQNPTKKITNGPPNPDRMKPKIIDKNNSNPNVNKPMRNTESAVVNGNLNGGTRVFNGPKKMKRKPGRPPESYSNNNFTTGGLDTELGYSEKQHMAHGVLLQLLKVTSQLPMAEFSYALDTLEVVTDAFRLGQRVSLNIRHDDGGDLISREGYGDTLIDRYLKEAALVTSTTTTTTIDDHQPQNPLVVAQMDGQFDTDALLKSLSTFDSVLSSGRREDERLVERMDVDVNDRREERRRGHKRLSNETVMPAVGNGKRVKR